MCAKKFSLIELHFPFRNAGSLQAPRQRKGSLPEDVLLGTILDMFFFS